MMALLVHVRLKRVFFDVFLDDPELRGDLVLVATQASDSEHGELGVEEEPSVSLNHIVRNFHIYYFFPFLFGTPVRPIKSQGPALK